LPKKGRKYYTPRTLFFQEETAALNIIKTAAWLTERMRAYLHYAGIHLKNETGYINIPERSFIRASFDTGQEDMSKIVKDEVDNVISGKKTAVQAMNTIGAQLVQMTQDFIRGGHAGSPLSDVAKERRASSTDTPLFDTGTNIVDRITYKIEGG